MKTNKVSAQSVFTLLEILLVVVIIGMLVSVAVVKLSGQSQRAKLVVTQRQIDAYKTALGIYELDNGFFPSSEQGLQALVTQPATPPGRRTGGMKPIRTGRRGTTGRIDCILACNQLARAARALTERFKQISCRGSGVYRVIPLTRDSQILGRN